MNLVFNEDKTKKMIAQCDNFDDFLDVDFDKVWKDRSKPFGHFISQEKNYRSKALKQADVVALLYLFRDQFDEETKRNCIDYYEGITTHDSSLSYIFHSLVFADIGDVKKSYEYLEKSLHIDLDHKGAAEGIHIANCGGIWQSIAMGLGGFRGIQDEGQLVVKPLIPDHISEIGYKVCLENEWYQVTATHEETTVERLYV